MSEVPVNLSEIYDLYSLAALDVFKDKNVPEWLSEHPALAKEPKKIFPRIGIKNFKEPTVIAPSAMLSMSDPIVTAVLSSLREVMLDLDDDIKRIPGNLGIRLRDEHERILYGIDKTDNIKVKEENERYTRARETLVNPVWEEYRGIARLLTNAAEIFRYSVTIAASEDGKIKLVVGANMSLNDKIVIRSGETIFRAYSKIKSIVDRFFKQNGRVEAAPILDHLTAIKKFNTLNTPLSSTTIVFSSEGAGVWDLATMSMRGLTSCQKWDGEYKECLIGSIASKYVGIIYLTSGSDYEGRGEKMIKRCIVRFGIDINNKKPIIIVDRMYDSYNDVIAKAFIEALQKRTNVPVFNYAALYASKQHDGIPETSYSDIPKNVELPQETLPNVYPLNVDQTEVPFDVPFGRESYMDTSFRRKQKKLPDGTERPRNEDDSVGIAASVLISIRDSATDIVRDELNQFTYELTVRDGAALIAVMTNIVYRKVTSIIYRSRIINPRIAKRLMQIKLIKLDSEDEDLKRAFRNTLNNNLLREDFKKLYTKFYYRACEAIKEAAHDSMGQE